jgi:hypothetical protein
MSADILHSGFDGLKFTIQTDIPPALRERLAEAKLRRLRPTAIALSNLEQPNWQFGAPADRHFPVTPASMAQNGTFWTLKTAPQTIPASQ